MEAILGETVVPTWSIWSTWSGEKSGRMMVEAWSRSWQGWQRRDLSREEWQDSTALHTTHNQQ